ncbi:MAG: glycosyltransferase family 4 protein [Vicinamibacterales bacterium]
MRIAIDARELGGQPTGVGRYLGEILRAWGAMPEARQHDYIFCAPAAMTCTGPLRSTTAIERGAGTWWEQGALPRLARAARAHVLFCPGYTGPVFDSTPLVVAVHDVSFAAHPEWFGWREGLRRRVITRASARRAARVLTLTRFAKREIVERLGVPEDRIEVVHPGVTSIGHGSGPGVRHASATGASEALVLYVGSIFNRRHVPETIKGFERLARRRPEASLTIVGDNRTFPRIHLDQVALDAQRVRLLAFVPDDVLGELYRRARAFVFLSEYEGFGLTPLDALAAGVPVVMLDTPVAREVFGNAAFYVGAPDPRLVEAALERALFDDDARRNVLHEAAGVVSRYSWSTCARRVLDVLQSVGSG